jgi:hypothetical protein
MHLESRGGFKRHFREEHASSLDAVFEKLSTFTSESFLGQVPLLVQELERQPISDEQSQQTLSAVLTALEDISEKAALYRTQLAKFRKRAEAA